MRLPCLYDKGERDFIGDGLGRLSDCLSCTVTESRNSDTEYELVMTYPIGGYMYELIKIDMVIGCLAHKHDTEIEAFRIYCIEDDMLTGTATIYARQVAMLLAAQTPITRLTVNGDAAAAMDYLHQHLAWYNNFNWLTMSSDITDTKEIEYKIPQKLMEFLISDAEHGLLANYGGEYRWHLYNIELLRERGEDAGGVVRYGKNMTSLRRTSDTSTVVTSILPYYAKQTEDGTTYLTTGNDPQSGMIFHADSMDTYYPHIELIDCTGDILAPEGASNQWMPTSDYVNEYAAAYLELNVNGEIPVTYEATVVDDPETVDVELHICDTVLLQHPAMGINVKAKITRTVYNVLSDQWESISIGTVRSNLAGTLYDMFDRRPTITKIQTGGGSSGTEGDWTWSIEGNIARLSYNHRYNNLALPNQINSFRASQPITITLPQYFASGWTPNRASFNYGFTQDYGGRTVQVYVSSYDNGTVTVYVFASGSTNTSPVTGNLTGSAILTRNQT